MKNINKSLSLVLVFVLLLSVFPFNVVYAVEENTASTQTQKTEEFVLPDIVPEAESAERGYIGRAKEEEKDNYTFVFKNSDNTRTMRVYSHPVKYTDDDGNIKDITLDIQSRADGGFETKDNSIKTTFGAKLSDGIRLQHENVDIKLIPANKNITPVLSEDKQTVTYTLDTKTSLEYSLTYMGFKEDIVVSEYTGQTEYEFLLYTNGLTVKEEMGSYYLADSEGNRKANIGDIIIFTADERNNTLGSLSCIEIKENQIYGLTIHVDEEYLKDEKTVYPIRIDPTFEITSATTEGAIEDVTVQTNATYSGTLGILYLGTSNNRKYRILMRFPNVDIPVVFPEMIVSASVEFRDVMCQSVPVAMECRYYNGSATAWSESGTTTWSSIGGDLYVGNLIDTKTIFYGNGNEGSDINRYSFDITEAAKNWADGTRSPQQGFIFRAADESFSSTEDRLKYFGSYNRSDYRTSLTIKYSHIAVYLITQNVNSVTHYLSAETSGNGGVQALTGAQVTARDTSENWLTPEYYGKTMWTVQYYPDSDAYRIISMGLKYSHGNLEIGIFTTSTSVGVSIIETSGNYTLFDVTKNSNGYRLKNRATNKYIALSSDNVLTSSATATSKTNFIFDAIETKTFNNFWPGSYNVGIYNGVAHIQVIVEASAYSNPTIEEDYFESVKVWNNLSDNVIIYGPGETVPSGIVPMVVTFKGKSFGSTTTMASTIGTNAEGITADQLPTVTYQNWSSVTIYISNDYVFSETNARKTIAHEMGHALKLTHPWQITNLQNVENGRGGYSESGDKYIGNTRVLSIMNQWPATDSTNLTASTPKMHDIINLCNKWGW